MKTTTLTVLLLSLCLLPCAVLAEDDVSGSVTLGIMGVDTEEYSAKFDEYRDMDDGTYGDVEIRAFKERYYLDLEAEKIGRDDQSYLLRGGRFGQFKYSLFYDETPHHLSAGSTTFYSGAGTDFLADTGVSSDPSRWQEVDYRRDRQSYGFDGELSFGSPFYVQFGASRINTDGIYPTAGNSTFPSFGRTTELPSPVDWNEAKGFLEGGYRTRNLTASLKAEFSDFNNSDEEFFWEDDFATNPAIPPDATTLPPDNEFWKVSGQIVWRMPALTSSLALRGTYSGLEDSVALRSTVADDAAGANRLAVEPEEFDGDITYATFDAAWSMVPVERLDLEVFFKYLDKNNDNTVVDIRAGGGAAETEVFDYGKWSAGIEGTYGLPGRTSIDAGYAYTAIDRTGRLDSEGSDDNLIYLQMRNRSWERLELRARYEYLNRDGEFEPKMAGDSPTDAAYIRNFVRRFDVADLVRQRVELEAATYLVDGLGASLEFGWQDDDYDETALGLTAVEHYDVYLTADYARQSRYGLGGYFGFENDKTDMNSRRYNPGDIADPSAGTSSSSAYNWSESKEFDTIAYGIFLEIPLGKRLLFSAAWDHSVVDGEAKFDSGGPPLGDFDEVEDYTKQELGVDLTYRFTEMMSLTAGYIYEKYDYDDQQWNGYEPLPTTSLLTGAYADSDYEANIGYLEATYRF